MTAFTPFSHWFATFLDPLALGIVGGGTVLTMVLRTPLADLGRGFAALAVLPRRRPFDGDAALARVEALGRIARRHGQAALERNVFNDPDLAAGVAALADGRSEHEVRGLLAHARQARVERHCAAADMWSAAAEAAPAMGMVGTLIGLARMFAEMADPAAIGAAMAVALLATLYGALLGNLVLLPIAARLRRLARSEALERARIELPLAALADTNRARVRKATAA